MHKRPVRIVPKSLPMADRYKIAAAILRRRGHAIDAPHLAPLLDLKRAKVRRYLDANKEFAGELKAQTPGT